MQSVAHQSACTQSSQPPRCLGPRPAPVPCARRSARGWWACARVQSRSACLASCTARVACPLPPHVSSRCRRPRGRGARPWPSALAGGRAGACSVAAASRHIPERRPRRRSGPALLAASPSLGQPLGMPGSCQLTSARRQAARARMLQACRLEGAGSRGERASTARRARSAHLLTSPRVTCGRLEQGGRVWRARARGACRPADSTERPNISVLLLVWLRVSQVNLPVSVAQPQSIGRECICSAVALVGAGARARIIHDAAALQRGTAHWVQQAVASAATLCKHSWEAPRQTVGKRGDRLAAAAGG